MPSSEEPVAVAGTAKIREGVLLLILDQQLAGQDTFLTGILELHGHHLQVRILRLDGQTALQPLTPPPGGPLTPPPGGPPIRWAGLLHLPHGQRLQRIPCDLEAAAARARIDLSELGAPEMRHLLSYVNESAEPDVRRQRIAAVIASLAVSS